MCEPPWNVDRSHSSAIEITSDRVRVLSLSFGKKWIIKKKPAKRLKLCANIFAPRPTSTRIVSVNLLIKQNGTFWNLPSLNGQQYRHPHHTFQEIDKKAFSLIFKRTTAYSLQKQMAALLLCRQLLCLRTSTIIIIIIIGIHIINNKVDASARVTFPPSKCSNACAPRLAYK